MPHNRRPPALFCNLTPKTLVLAATGASVCFSLIQNITVAFACFLLSVLLVVAGRCPLAFLLKRLAVANFFIIFLWATIPVTVPGENLAQIGPLSISREGIELALSVTIKCNAILLCFIVFMFGLTLPLIGYALEGLHIPVKLVFLFLFTCRYIHVIGEEWKKLQTAAKLRGFMPRTSLHTYRTIGNMLGLTLIKSIDRSKVIYESMLLRGFNGVFHTVTEVKTTRNDFFFTVFFFSILVCLLGLDVYLRLRHV